MSFPGCQVHFGLVLVVHSASLNGVLTSRDRQILQDLPLNDFKDAHWCTIKPIPLLLADKSHFFTSCYVQILFYTVIKGKIFILSC